MYKCDTLFWPRHALNSLVESEAVWAIPTPGLKRRTSSPQGGQGSVTRHRTGRFTWGGLSTHSGRWSTLGRPAMGQSYVAPSIHSGRHTESYATHCIQFPPNKSPLLGLIAQQSPPMRSIPVKGGGCPLLQFSTGPQQPRGGALGLFLEQWLKRESPPMAATRSSGLFGWLLCTSSCFVEHQVIK